MYMVRTSPTAILLLYYKTISNLLNKYQDNIICKNEPQTSIKNTTTREKYPGIPEFKPRSGYPYW